MPRFTRKVWIALAVPILAIPVPAVAGGDVHGRLYDPGGGWKELFPWCVRTGEGKMVGNFTDMGGYFPLPGLQPGTYVFGFSRRFGLGPVIAPAVTVSEGKATYVVLLKCEPYDVHGGKDKSQAARLFAQGFVSRGECVRRAWFDLAVPQGTELIYAVREGTPDGRQIGPESPDGRWEPGQVRLLRGKTYFLAIHRKDGQPFSVLLARSDHAETAFADGRPIVGALIGGKINADRTGIIVDSFPKEGDLWGPCTSCFAQTFVARSTSLAMVDFIPAVGGGRREGTAYAIRVLESGPEGRQVGPTRISRGSDMIPSGYGGFQLRCALWNRDEVPLVPGRKYCIGIKYHVEAGQEPQSFRISTHEGDFMGGEFYKDNQVVQGKCLDTVMIEYEPDNSPPPPAVNLRADLAGTAVQLSFDVPEDMDVNAAAVSRSSNGQSEELARSYACPGRMEVYVDRDARPNRSYEYSVVLLDGAGNRSPAAKVSVQVKPLTAESNLLINGDFVASSSASGGLCPGWDTASLAHGASWSVSAPKNEGDAYHISAWQKYSTYDVVAFQKVPVAKGTTCTLTVMTDRKDPFNNGNVNEVTLVGIDPMGGSNPAADSVVWSASEYQSNTWLKQAARATAQSDNITVYLRARSLYSGFGMEGVFSKACLRISGHAVTGGAK
jgi:hypothetical protein